MDSDKYKESNFHLNYKSIISNDIICFEKLTDFLLLRLKINHSIIWQDRAFLECVAVHYKCKRIAKKDFITNDNFRSPQCTMILGDNSIVNIVENKIKYTFDIQKCMFSRGNITEKLRISKMDCSGQVVVDLYAGIGYFALSYLVHSKAEHLYACEWNNDAIEALRINLAKNKVSNKCTILEGDNVKTCPQNIADHVNLGLIPSCEESWPTACSALKRLNGGILHIHGTIHKNYTINNQHIESSHIQVSNKSRDLVILNENIQKQDINLEDLDMAQNETYSHSSSKNNVSNNSPFYNKDKMDKIINSNNEQIKMMKLKKDLEHSWIEWSYYVCYKLQNIFVNLYKIDWDVQLIHIEHVKSYAPHISHLVLDIKCRPSHL